MESETSVIFNFDENDLVGPSEWNVHESEKSYKCTMCDYSCAQEDDLKKHTALVHSENYKIVPGCKKNAKLYQLNGFLYRINSKRPRQGPTEKIYLNCQEREETREGRKVIKCPGNAVLDVASNKMVMKTNHTHSQRVMEAEVMKLKQDIYNQASKPFIALQATHFLLSITTFKFLCRRGETEKLFMSLIARFLLLDR